jgi:TonB-like protein
MPSKHFPALATLLVAVVVPTSLSAQMVEAGVARDATSRTPYECLHVALLDSSGRAIEHTVTDSAGRFLLEAPRPGIYRVQFNVVGAEPIAGPLDTLNEGDSKQRAFPLVFRRLLRDADSANAGPDFQARRQRDSLLLRSLSEQESDSGWKSRIAVAGPYGPVYPKQLRIAGEGGYVVSQFIVDSTGKTRPDSWHAIDATNVDFAKAVAASVPQWRWKPARNRGQPVCELGLDFITFHTEYGSGWNVGHVIIYR